jgi:peptidyl-prolyl cis-trans isomerase B (cyclophilin B)
LLVLIPLTGCKKDSGDAAGALRQLAEPQNGDTVAIFETDHGTFKAVLFSEFAPLAVDNFVTLANSGYYDGLIFHRVVAEFVIQTGDPTGVGNGGSSASGNPFKNEYAQELHHYTGALGMANSGTDLNQSQFYAVQGAAVSDAVLDQMRTLDYSEDVIAAYKETGGVPSLDYRYTVFGQVYEGLDVVAKINAVETDENDRPLKEVVLKKVTIETYQQEITPD